MSKLSSRRRFVSVLTKAKVLLGWDGDRLEAASLTVFEKPLGSLTEDDCLLFQEWLEITAAEQDQPLSPCSTVMVTTLDSHGLPNDWHQLIAINNQDIKRLGMNAYMAGWYLKKKFPPKYSRHQLTDQQLYDWVAFCRDWADSVKPALRA